MTGRSPTHPNPRGMKKAVEQQEIDELVDDIRDGTLTALSENGWNKGYEVNDDGEMCVIGALRFATEGDWWVMDLFRNSARVIIADLFPGSPTSIESFNDFEHTSQ